MLGFHGVLAAQEPDTAGVCFAVDKRGLAYSTVMVTSHAPRGGWPAGQGRFPRFIPAHRAAHVEGGRCPNPSPGTVLVCLWMAHGRPSAR